MLKKDNIFAAILICGLILFGLFSTESWPSSLSEAMPLIVVFILLVSLAFWAKPNSQKEGQTNLSSESTEVEEGRLDILSLNRLKGTASLLVSIVVLRIIISPGHEVFYVTNYCLVGASFIFTLGFLFKRFYRK